MNKNSVFDQVRGRWGTLLPLLGVPEEHLTGRHCPCPICGGTDRFRFDNKQGFGTWICSQCGAGGPLKLLELLFGWGPAEVARRLEIALRIAPADVAMRPENRAIVHDVIATAKLMERLWDEGEPAKLGGWVWDYLRSRGISYNQDVINLRERGHEMLAKVQLPDGTPCQLHRTVIESGKELKRYLMRGPHPAGSSVHLMRWGLGTLGIAEGIETALSAAQCYNMPVWAALNANRLKTWVPPAQCTNVIIFADHDESHVGRDAAVELAKRLDDETLVDVKIRMPSKCGFDYNDVLIEARCGDAISKFSTRQ